jgi:hypothetical protein
LVATAGPWAHVDRREVAEAVGGELAQHPGVPGTGRLRAVGAPGGLQWGQQMLAHDAVEEDADREVAGEADHQRGHGPSPQHPDQRAESQREEGVAEDHGAFGVEDAVVHAALQAHERHPPPGHEEHEHAGGHDGRRDGEPELGHQPAAARDALRPVQPLGALLERHQQRRGQHGPDQAGQQRQPGDQAAEAVEAHEELVDRLLAGLRRPRACARGQMAGVERGGDVEAGGEQDHGQYGEHGGDDRRLGALLTPSDPDHRATASASGRLAP